MVVAELLDAGGLGEKIVPFMRHAKARLLKPGGRCLPRGLRIRGVLLHLKLAKCHGVAWNPSGIESFSASKWHVLSCFGALTRP